MSITRWISRHLFCFCPTRGFSRSYIYGNRIVQIVRCNSCDRLHLIDHGGYSVDKYRALRKLETEEVAQ